MLAIFQTASWQTPGMDSLIRRFDQKDVFVRVQDDRGGKHLKQWAYDSRGNFLKPFGKYPPDFE
jgi:hypothetical protein